MATNTFIFQGNYDLITYNTLCIGNRRGYYLWSPVILKAMEGDDAFKEEVNQMMDGSMKWQ